MGMLREPINFTIPVAPVTKKNHGQIVTMKNGRSIMLPSKQYRQYENECGHYMRGRGVEIDCPVNVKAIYYTKTRRKVDLCNLHAALHDMLVKHHVLADDNASIIVSTDGSRVRHDKYNPRTEVWIEPLENEPYQVGILDENDW